MTTMTQVDPSYTRDEQITALTHIIGNNSYIPQRRLARLVWQSANGMITELTMNDSFHRDASALTHVPLATVYNRIRRITGKIK